MLDTNAQARTPQISDRVSAGTSTDMSGPAMADVLHQVDKVQVDVVATKVVPDDVSEIQAVVKGWADSDAVDLILTSGGTGFSPRDVTPEAIKAVLDKEIPGFRLRCSRARSRLRPRRCCPALWPAFARRP